jgi:hypothetical protein
MDHDEHCLCTLCGTLSSAQRRDPLNAELRSSIARAKALVGAIEAMTSATDKIVSTAKRAEHAARRLQRRGARPPIVSNVIRANARLALIRACYRIAARHRIAIPDPDQLLDQFLQNSKLDPRVRRQMPIDSLRVFAVALAYSFRVPDPDAGTNDTPIEVARGLAAKIETELNGKEITPDAIKKSVTRYRQRIDSHLQFNNRARLFQVPKGAFALMMLPR